MSDQKIMPKCPRCSGNTVKHGFRKTVKKGSQQMYKCIQCAHVFVPEHLPEGLR